MKDHSADQTSCPLADSNSLVTLATAFSFSPPLVPFQTSFKMSCLLRRRLFQGSPMFSAPFRMSHDILNPFPPVSAHNYVSAYVSTNHFCKLCSIWISSTPLNYIFQSCDYFYYYSSFLWLTISFIVFIVL